MGSPELHVGVGSSRIHSMELKGEKVTVKEGAFYVLLGIHSMELKEWKVLVDGSSVDIASESIQWN